jgi:ABC-type Fe3+ transport system permease subunit
VLATAVILVALGVPLVSLVLSLRDRSGLVEVVRAFGPQLGGTLLVAGATFLGSVGLAFLATVVRPNWALVAGVVTFLSGGLVLAIALIRTYNHPWSAWVYDTAAIAWLAYMARYGFLGLFAGLTTFLPAATGLRELAKADGAGAWEIAWRVVWPVSWPGMLAAALGAALLCMGEVPATVLLSPQRPPLLTPLLMTWVHMQRYDPMIQASLLLAATVVAAVGTLLTAYWLLIGQKKK